MKIVSCSANLAKEDSMAKSRIPANILGILAFILIAARPGLSQTPLTILPIKGGIYLVKGASGANTGLYIGEKEVVVIDSKMTADATRQVIEEIKKLTDKPITRIILTHSDGDHINGINGFPAGLMIYGHPQTRKDMEEAAKSPNMQYLREYLPNQECQPCTAGPNGAMNLRIGSEEIRLYYFGPAHTGGDLEAFFPAERVAFVGDLAFVGRDPLIHRQKGGTSTGYLSTLKALLALNAETYLSGHSDPLRPQDLQALAVSIEEKQGKVKAMVGEGRSLDEIKKAFGIQPAAAQSGRPGFPSLVEIIYLELTERK
jgi:cyclase